MSITPSPFAPLNELAVRKYMRMAKELGEDNNPCYSRQIGTVLVKVHDDGHTRVLSTGYNGPPKKTPHCDSREYLERVVWPQLTQAEQFRALDRFGLLDKSLANDEEEDKRLFLDAAAGCKQCPRRVVGAASGERTGLCSCQHSERNAISNAADDLHGSWAFCWCGVPCWECAGAMINAGIKRVFTVEQPDYSAHSRQLFAWANVPLFSQRPEWYLESACE